MNPQLTIVLHTIFKKNTSLLENIFNKLSTQYNFNNIELLKLLKIYSFIITQI